jgi:hypothetical protein
MRTMRETLIDRGIPADALTTLPKVATWDGLKFSGEELHRMMRWGGGIKGVATEPDHWYGCAFDPTIGIDIAVPHECTSTCFTTCKTGRWYVTRREAELLEQEQAKGHKWTR